MRKSEPLAAQLTEGASVHMDVVTEQWMRERPDLDLYDFMMTLYLLRLARILEAAFAESSQKDFSLGVAEMRILLALRRNGKPYAQRPTDLFRALLVSSGAVTKQVDRLEAAGLVERLPDPLSFGAVQITLTDKGLELVDSAATAISQRCAMKQATAALSESERVAAINIFRKMLRAMEDTDLEGVDAAPLKNKAAAASAKAPRQRASGAESVTASRDASRARLLNLQSQRRRSKPE